MEVIQKIFPTGSFFDFADEKCPIFWFNVQSVLTIVSAVLSLTVFPIGWILGMVNTILGIFCIVVWIMHNRKNEGIVNSFTGVGLTPLGTCGIRFYCALLGLACLILECLIITFIVGYLLCWVSIVANVVAFVICILKAE